MKSWQTQLISGAVGVFLLDQASKYLAMSLGMEVVINEGISFGWRPAGEWLFLALAFVLGGAVALSWRYWSRAPIATGFFLGGITANLTDRLVFGGVRDWLPIPLTGLYNNLADWGITIAVLLVLYELYRTQKNTAV